MSYLIVSAATTTRRKAVNKTENEETIDYYTSKSDKEYRT